MNKQKLIEKIKNLKHHVQNKSWVDRRLVLNLIEQLDEPEKVKVPQFVADWYEEHKDIFEYSLFDYVYRFDQQKESDFKDWFDDFKTKALQTLVNMHQFGYTVEEEKRYLVKVKGIDTNFNFLNRHRNENYWIFSSKDKNTLYQTHHTRKQLEDAGFGEVFNSTLFEVEEVED